MATINVYPASSNSASVYSPLMASYVSTGASLLGLTSYNTWRWEWAQGAVTNPPFPVSNVGSGANAAPTVNQTGGWIKMTSGATSGSSYRTSPNWVLAHHGHIANAGTKKWYVAFRAAIVTAIDSQTKASFGILDSGTTKSIKIGVFGSSSTTNFVVQYDGNEAGSFIDTGVAIDTGIHVFELWGKGDSKVYGRIDGSGSIVSATMSAVGTNQWGGMSHYIQNGTTATAREMECNWDVLVTE